MGSQSEAMQDVYEVAEGPIATRLAVLENEVGSLKQQLAQAQQQVMADSDYCIFQGRGLSNSLCTAGRFSGWSMEAARALCWLFASSAARPAKQDVASCICSCSHMWFAASHTLHKLCPTTKYAVALPSLRAAKLYEACSSTRPAVLTGFQ